MSMTLYHFPGCPYSERIEILLALKGLTGTVEDVELDLSKPRPDWLLLKTNGSTSLPVLDCGAHILKESAVLLRFFDSVFPARRIAREDPLAHAIEAMLGALDSAYTKAGYAVLLNQDRTKREELCAAFDAQYEALDSFLRRYGGDGPFLFDEFGWAEVIFTPMMKRLETLSYYEGYKIPGYLARVRSWHAACLRHPAAQTRSVEEVIKLYYDYSRGVGGGKIVPGRRISSFTRDVPWQSRPMPPRDKWQGPASDEALGLA
jgi:glutathione S-transferase